MKIANSAKLIPGIVGLTILSFFNTIKPVEAAIPTCSSGDNWVNTCTSGIYDFSTSVTNTINLFSPNNQPDFSVLRLGKTSLVIGNPVDKIIADPLLGDVGSLDGSLDAIKLEIFNSTATGFLSFSSMSSSVSVGDGTPDLAPTPFETTSPFKSLYTAGAIIQRKDNTALADSFLKVFIETEGAEGLLRNKEPITVNTVSPLIGFPFLGEQSSIVYANNDIIPLFTAGPDGIFWSGDEIEFARIVPDASGSGLTFSLAPVKVPEASTTLPCILFGLVAIFRYKRKQLAKYKIL